MEALVSQIQSMTQVPGVLRSPAGTDPGSANQAVHYRWSAGRHLHDRCGCSYAVHLQQPVPVCSSGCPESWRL